MSPKQKNIAYWVTTGLFAAALTGSGVMNIIGHEEIVKSVASLGFPEWFPHYLGTWKIIGVATLLLPGLARWKEWAMAGFTISLTSAAVAHIANGDPIGTAIPPLVLLAIGLVGWYLRPESRRLPDAA